MQWALIVLYRDLNPRPLEYEEESTYYWASEFYEH